MITKAYLHSSKSTMKYIGEDAGLEGLALDRFVYALYEVEFTLDVDEDTGEYKILEVKET